MNVGWRSKSWLLNIECLKAKKKKMIKTRKKKKSQINYDALMTKSFQHSISRISKNQKKIYKTRQCDDILKSKWFWLVSLKVNAFKILSCNLLEGDNKPTKINLLINSRPLLQYGLSIDHRKFLPYDVECLPYDFHYVFSNSELTHIENQK